MATKGNTESKSEKTIDRVYNYVKHYIKTNTYSPSVRDICKGAGLKSTSSVHMYLKKLDEMGVSPRYAKSDNY